MFYLKLALNNIKNSKGIFAPFILASLVLYLLNGSTLLVLFSPVADSMRHGQQALTIATGVLTLFSVIMSIYSFNFLLKQRSKEFGLYNMLGMNKRQVGLVASLELAVIFLLLVFSGSLASSAFSNLLFLIFVRIIQGTDLSFSLSPQALIANVAIFAGIFALLNLICLFKVGKSSPLTLFRTQESGEQEPRGNVILAGLALLFLGGGYYLSLTSTKIVALVVLYRFALAVILVILGTYLFYIAFMAWFLKHRRANKAYFYQPQHFIMISQMIFRIKQHATGLANITLLAVMAFVTIATTTSLHTGMIQAKDKLFIRDSQVTIFTGSESGDREIFENQVLSQLDGDKDYVNYMSVMFPLALGREKTITATAQSIAETSGGDLSYLYVASLEDFRKFGNQVEDLAPDQAYFYLPGGKSRFEAFDVLGHQLTIKDNLKTVIFPDVVNTVSPALIVVANAEIRDQIYSSYAGLEAPMTPYDSNLQVAIDLTEEEKERIARQPGFEEFISIVDKKGFETMVLGFTGGFLFTGFLLGIAFLLGAALIIYYKQYSEGHEDKRSYRILQEVGLSAQTVKKTINSQVLTVFFMPLVMAVVHFLVALVMIKQMLLLFGVTSSHLIYTVSGLVIAGVILVYFLIYKVTSRVYYKIVER